MDDPQRADDVSIAWHSQSRLTGLEKHGALSNANLANCANFSGFMGGIRGIRLNELFQPGFHLRLLFHDDIVAAAPGCRKAQRYGRNHVFQTHRSSLYATN